MVEAMLTHSRFTCLIRQNKREIWMDNKRIYGEINIIIDHEIIFKLSGPLGKRHL